ncbi:MAG: serine/threonine protein kinase, partial [Planctomycetales bacterium]|nr:serine/threonine protein kinase [Planctomycetales bacterium]
MKQSLDKLAIEIVDRVLDLPLDERPAMLSSACAGDEELRQKVESLLRAMQHSGEVLQADDSLQTLKLPWRGTTRFQRGDRLIDRYIIDELLGIGGMGEVYRALDTRLDRIVAVKTLNLACLASAELSVRFQREMKATAALANNNIVTVFDFATHDGTQFAVMEFVEGLTVRELIDRKIDQSKALAILSSAAEGLAAAHSMELMHRDIKPENIMVTDLGQAKILDFGLARQELPSIDQRLTNTGASPGTVPYMSPEQAMAKQLTCATDVFSLGIVAFELLTGTNPFRGATAFLTMQRICDCQIPRLSNFAGEVPAGLEE